MRRAHGLIIGGAVLAAALGGAYFIARKKPAAAINAAALQAQRAQLGGSGAQPTGAPGWQATQRQGANAADVAVAAVPAAVALLNGLLLSDDDE